MCCLKLIKFDVSNNSYYYDEVENGTLFVPRAVMENDPWRSWKIHGKF